MAKAREVKKAKKTAIYDLPPVQCKYCPETFIGAIYDDQPNDCCFDCYHKNIAKYPQLWKRVRDLLKSSPDAVAQGPLGVMGLLATLSADKFITIHPNPESL